MKVSRRTALLGGVSLAAFAGGLGIAARPGGIAAHARQVIGRVYGADVAEHPATQAFCAAYEAFVFDKGLPGRAANAIFNLKAANLPYVQDETARMDRSIVVKFATSTNVVLAQETGAELEFAGIFHPVQSSCSNQLSHFGLLWAEPVASAG